MELGTASQHRFERNTMVALEGLLKTEIHIQYSPGFYRGLQDVLASDWLVKGIARNAFITKDYYVIRIEIILHLMRCSLTCKSCLNM